MRNMRLLLASGAMLLLTAWPGQAQWVTQTLSLKPGWNAVSLFMEPVSGGCDAVFTNLPVRSVWLWDRQFTTRDFITDPAHPLPEDDYWRYWYASGSGMSFASDIRAISAGQSYLIEVNSNAAPFTVTLKGQPMLPAPRWVPHEMNLVGFPSAPGTGPYFLDYFRGLPHIDVSTTYDPGLFSVRSGSTGLPLTAPARTRMERGVAYWVRLRDVTGCVAPFTISGLGSGLIDFSTNGVTQDFTLVNNSTSAVQVVLSTAASEAPPTGQPGLAGPVPLSWYHVISFTNSTWVSFTAPFTVTVPASGQAGVRLGIRRGDLGLAKAGELFQSLVNVQDADGRVLYQLPVRATPNAAAGFRSLAAASTQTNVSSGLPASSAFEGLWVGGADITAVNNPVPTTNGWDYTTLSPTRSAFPVTLLVHVDSNGVSRLLQRVLVVPTITGPTNATTTDFTLYADESLVPAGSSNVVRLCATTIHYLPPQVMSGSFFLTNTCSYGLDYNDPLNPFKHLYHPYHDNLTSNYQTNLPPGIESYTLNRAVTLSFTSLTNFTADPMWGATEAAGIYSETITGLREWPVICAGPFGLRRINTVNTLQQ